MNFEKTVRVPATMEIAWSLLTDIPRVGMCLPGATSVERIEDGVYTGAMNVKVGVIRVSFQGRIEVVDQDAAERLATMKVQADDKRVGSAVNATMEMRLTPGEEGSVDLHVRSEAAVFGKLGELGQAVMLKKADQIMTEFAANLAHELRSGEADARGAPGAGVLPPEPPASAVETEPRRQSLWRSLGATLRRLSRRGADAGGS